MRTAFWFAPWKTPGGLPSVCLTMLGAAPRFSRRRIPATVTREQGCLDACDPEMGRSAVRVGGRGARPRLTRLIEAGSTHLSPGLESLAPHRELAQALFLRVELYPCWVTDTRHFVASHTTRKSQLCDALVLCDRRFGEASEVSGQAIEACVQNRVRQCWWSLSWHWHGPTCRDILIAPTKCIQATLVRR